MRYGSRKGKRETSNYDSTVPSCIIAHRSGTGTVLYARVLTFFLICRIRDCDESRGDGPLSRAMRPRLSLGGQGTYPTT